MNETALKLQEDTSITKEDVRKYLCEKATDKEIELFLITCKLHGLNPLKREAYLIKYGSAPAQTVVGYETYLKRAEATGLLNGWECTADDESASIIIWRKDREHPFKWTIQRKEFDKKVAMWNAMPRHMMSKTVISIGFRLCFPEHLGGMPYTKEEMEGTGEGAKEYGEIPPGTATDSPDKPSKARSQPTHTKPLKKIKEDEKLPLEPDLLQEEEPQKNMLDVEHMKGSIRAMVKEMYPTKKQMVAYMHRIYGNDFTTLNVLDEPTIILLYDKVLADYNQIEEGE